MSSSKSTQWQTMPPFPKQTINKMVRFALPKKVRISPEFIDAVNRCVQIYVISVTSTALRHYKTSHLTDKKVIEIIGLMGFQHFIQPLDQLNKELKERKSKTRKLKKLKENVGNVFDLSESQGFDPKTESVEEVNTEVTDNLM